MGFLLALSWPTAGGLILKGRSGGNVAGSAVAEVGRGSCALGLLA
jgi:hypothetical protein